MKPIRTESAIILPIHPIYVERIRIGMKRVEFRAKIWNERSDIKTVFVYETNPTSAIVGYFEIADTLIGSPEDVYVRSGLFAGIEHQKYVEYSEGRDVMHGLVIKYPIFFKNPVPISLLDSKMRAPQSFYYCDDGMIDKIMKLGRSKRKAPTEEDLDSYVQWMTEEDGILLKYISTQSGSIARNQIH